MTTPQPTPAHEAAAFTRELRYLVVKLSAIVRRHTADIEHRAIEQVARNLATLTAERDALKAERDEAQGEVIIKGASIAVLRDKSKVADAVDLRNAALIDKLQEERDALAARVKELEGAIDFSQGELREMTDAHQMLMRHHETVNKLCDDNEDELTDLRAQLALAKGEIQVLRDWGNKDCTAMADDELAKRRAARQEPRA